MDTGLKKGGGKWESRSEHSFGEESEMSTHVRGQESMKLRNIGLRVVQGIAITWLVAASGLMTAPASQAGGSCIYPYCSETYNRSNASVQVAHDWCKADDERRSQEDPPCGSSSKTMVLWPGEHTPSHEDWDAFRADAGC